MSVAKIDYRLVRLEEDPDEKPCPSCGRWGYEPGGVHEALGPVCSSCWTLLHEPIMPGMMPVAWVEGWPYRAERPRRQG